MNKLIFAFGFAVIVLTIYGVMDVISMSAQYLR